MEYSRRAFLTLAIAAPAAAVMTRMDTGIRVVGWDPGAPEGEHAAIVMWDELGVIDWEVLERERFGRGFQPWDPKRQPMTPGAILTARRR